QLNVDPSIGVGKEKIKQKKDDNKYVYSDDSNAIRLLLGEIRFLFNRTEGGAAEQIEIPLSILVDDDEDRCDIVNGYETQPIIQRVTEFVMTAEADAARTRAIEEMERGNSNGARYVLNAHRKRQQAIQQVTFNPTNCGVDLDEESEIGSSSKDGAINVSEKTKKSAVALAAFMSKQAPELQILHQQFYQQHTSHQVYQNQNLARKAFSNDDDYEYDDEEEEDDDGEFECCYEEAEEEGCDDDQLSGNRSYSHANASSIHAQSSNTSQSIQSIPKPPPITLLPPEKQSSLQGNINRALFKQQQDLDEIEEQLAAAVGNAALSSHLMKQSKQRSYAHAQGINSAAASATASSSATAEPDIKGLKQPPK
ncbi:MAG: hypothetical protein EZS28_038433, partial [Streblomastix strix]